MNNCRICRTSGLCCVAQLTCDSYFFAGLKLKFPPEKCEVLLYFPAFELGSGVVALPTS